MGSVYWRYCLLPWRERSLSAPRDLLFPRFQESIVMFQSHQTENQHEQPRASKPHPSKKVWPTSTSTLSCLRLLLPSTLPAVAVQGTMLLPNVSFRAITDDDSKDRFSSTSQIRALPATCLTTPVSVRSHRMQLIRFRRLRKGKSAYSEPKDPRFLRLRKRKPAFSELKDLQISSAVL